MSTQAFDRAAEDLGNIVNLGHVNFRVPDQRLATAFYVSGLGLTRDPILMTGVENMWVNVGDSQFHLPTGPAVFAPGVITGLVIPDLGALRERLARVQPLLVGTRFAIREIEDGIEVLCPWGNQLRLHEPNGSRFDPRGLGLAYVHIQIPLGRAPALAQFYREVMRARVVEQSGLVRIVAGLKQWLIFEEREAPEPVNPDFHIQIYLANFSGPYAELKRRGGQIEESNQWQYRIKMLPDCDGAPLFVLDHEIRSMTHPMYGRPLANRNPEQSLARYRASRDYF